MRWPVDVLAFYLLDSGLPEKQTGQVLLSSWPHTYGDDAYGTRDMIGSEPYRFGAYYTPSSWFNADRDLQRPRLMRQALVTAWGYGQYLDSFGEFYPPNPDATDDLTTAVLHALKHPRAGITAEEQANLAAARPDIRDRIAPFLQTVKAF